MFNRKIATFLTATGLLALSGLPANAGTAVNRNARGINFGVRAERGRVHRVITQNTHYTENGAGFDGAIKIERESSCINRCWGRKNTFIATGNGRLFDYSVDQTTNIRQTEDAAYVDVQGYGEVYQEHTVQSLSHTNW